MSDLSSERVSLHNLTDDIGQSMKSDSAYLLDLTDDIGQSEENANFERAQVKETSAQEQNVAIPTTSATTQEKKEGIPMTQEQHEGIILPHLTTEMPESNPTGNNSAAQVKETSAQEKNVAIPTSATTQEKNEDIPMTQEQHEGIILQHLTAEMPESYPTGNNSAGVLHKCGEPLSVELKSIGFVDIHPTAGTGYIKVNHQVLSQYCQTSVPIGEAAKREERGTGTIVHVVLWEVDRDHGGIYLATYHPEDIYFSNAKLTSYDTHGSSEDAEELNDYIVGLPEFSVVLGVTIGSTGKNIHLASDALNILGLKKRLPNNLWIKYHSNSIAFVSKIGSGLLNYHIRYIAGPSVLYTNLETRPCGCQENAIIFHGSPIYFMQDGLENGRVVNIHGYTKANPKKFSINLWSDDKTKIAWHYDMRYIDGSIVINTLRHSSPCSFPYGELGFWNSEIRPSDPIPVERNSPFHIQISANGSSDFLIKFIGAGYERTFRNRLEVPLRDITWLAINQQNGSVFIEHICIWSEFGGADGSLNNEHNLQYSQGERKLSIGGYIFTFNLII